jgi:two-component system sensor histidine kinase KdpD
LDWTDLRDVINSALNKVQKELAGHSVSVDVSPSLPLIRLDFPLMEQVFVNLLRNAVMHTPESSTIDIKAHIDQSQSVITVADNGPGFPDEALPRIFEKFYRVPGAKTGGIGLGLSIVRGFVEAHHGTVTVENRRGGGAQFIIRLPVGEKKSTHVEPANE